MNAVRRTWTVAALAALGAILLSGAPPGLSQGRRGSEELMRLVPRLEAFPLAEELRSFFPDDLFEYIDGAAESYLSYDFRELVVADLKKKGTEATVTLEIYDMGEPVNAFGIFSTERSPEAPAADVGDLGYLEGEVLNFMAGRYYVKLLAFGTEDGTAAVLREIGARVAAGVKDKGRLPPFVLAFPRRGLIDRSERYVKKNVMGYAFLSDGYFATYRLGERSVEAFLIDAASESEAGAKLERLLEAVVADGQTVQAAGPGRVAKDRYGKRLYIARSGPVLFGLTGVPEGSEDEALKLFEEIASSAARLGSRS